MTRLTTHVLDQAAGRPAAGVRLRLYREGETDALADTFTNADGRVDQPLLEGSDVAGRYVLVFSVGDYFAANGQHQARFLDDVPVAFTLADEAHYHVPLLVTPWAYSVYRGS
ncbi:hydroxyisourate hydrolase [Larsenimonas rhizosphaerae]|uniref:5-hydroxyisourate hydrolase n=1 Tax=Larsenimonas rhizosphaerae TaxID=2944682 RepID=A0AA41ZKL9_9GAMM|nr:hydroxyisourate hydrolase [Larsenimonas rhizosphaerae]MCM2130764.1 hydroxyisourate hydrolase [Larsenimonas rhizosphaerae]MCX2523468.1 hydroxyisourate hydrolase [Larsenimonas rhizosphaerae]